MQQNAATLQFGY